MRHYYTLRPSQRATILWGGPPARGRPPGRPARAREEPDQGSGADEGVRPTFGWQATKNDRLPHEEA